MAIFGKDRAQSGARNGSTIIAAGTQFVGNLTLSDNLHVDGRIDGDIDSQSGVVVGAEGCLKGSIRARTVVVSGRVDGSISAQRLEIVTGGSVEGDVHTVDLVIEPGGRFNGSSEILAEAGDASKAGNAADASTAARPAASPATEAGTKSDDSPSAATKRGRQTDSAAVESAQSGDDTSARPGTERATGRAADSPSDRVSRVSRPKPSRTFS